MGSRNAGDWVQVLDQLAQRLDTTRDLPTLLPAMERLVAAYNRRADPRRWRNVACRQLDVVGNGRVSSGLVPASTHPCVPSVHGFFGLHPGEVVLRVPGLLRQPVG